MRKRWYLILPIILFLISCCDLGATLYFDHICDHFEEANPLAAHVWDNHGNFGLIIFKLAVTLPSCLCMGWILTNKRRSLRIAASIFGLMVGNLITGWWIFWIFS